MFKQDHRYTHLPLAIRLAAVIGGLVLGIALLVMGFGVVREHVTPAAPQPRVGRVPAVTVNFGDQLPGQLLQRRVLVPNAGPAAIQISQVITSCGCLQSTLEPRTIPPGQAGVLTLQIATRPWPGPELITATLLGTTRSMSIIRQYLVQYTVRRLIHIASSKGALGEPYYLDLGTISVDSNPKPFHASVTRGTYPAHWNSWRCFTGSRKVVASIRKTGNGTWMLSLIPKGLTILGSQSYMLRFSFYNKGKKLRYHYSQPVNFTVRGPVELEPGTVFFGANSYGTTAVKHLRLITSETGRTGTGRILSVKSTDPKHAIVSIINGGESLRVAFHAVGPKGGTTGRFLVTAEYGGSRYQFRVDYLADVIGIHGAK